MIDKFVPRQLNTDDDQRYLQEGDMIDAINITLAEDGANSRVILKNERGTTAYDAANNADIIPAYPLTVIGSVSDSQRRRIYFFAASNQNGSQYNDFIYMVDMDTEEYSVVYSTPTNRFLNFNPNSFVKADVLNRDVQRDGGLQTILYFTDDINPPRKINVDRAIAGDYDALTEAERPYALNSIKAAPTRSPIATLDTDTTFTENNFVDRVFQFATQFVYDDGEESAISPYSDLVFIDDARVTGVSDTYSPVIFGILREEQNVCIIDTRFRNGSGVATLSANVDIPEVQDIRILAREDNNGAWFVVDQFNARQNLTRRVAGASVTVYNPNSGQYRFYNDGAYRTVSSLQTDKLYDNVPRLATGQAVSGNRLVYSNYLEGYNNDGTPTVTISPNYLGDVEYDGNGGVDVSGAITPITSDVAGVSDSVNDDYSIRVNFLEMFSDASAASYALEPNSQTVLEFTWEPKGTVSSSSSALFQIEGSDSSNDRVVYGVGDDSQDPQFNSVDLNSPSPTEENKFTFTFTFTAGENDTIGTLSNAFALYVEELQWSNSWSETSFNLDQLTADQDILGTGHESTIADSAYQISQPEITQAWKFETVSTGGSTYIQPYIYFMSVYGDNTYQTGSGGNNPFDPGSGTTYWNTMFQSEGFPSNQTGPDYSFNTNLNTLSDFAFSSESVNTITTFKAGAIHEFAMVFYDEFLRNGPVIKLGNSYVKHVAEREDNTEGKGAVSMSITFPNSDNIPDWAESYRILYPGNSSFQSIFTGGVQGAHVMTDASADVTTAVIDDNKRHIYVSLDGLEKLQENMSVRTKYQFSEGDKLRVVSYKTAANDTTNIAQNNLGGIVEFDVVGTVTLEDDTSNPLREGNYVAGNLVQYNKVGRFLVLAAPQVDAAVQNADGNRVRYPGFDWYSLSNTDYPYQEDGAQVTSSNNNFWNQECVVEILTPKNRTEDVIYYEVSPRIPIGTRRTVQGEDISDYGPTIELTNGDAFFRPVLISANQYVNNAWTQAPKDRIIKSHFMESDRYSDKRGRPDWGRGRAHLPLTEGQERRRFNSLTYSEAVVDDLNTLYTSSFDKNLSNFLDLLPTYGALNYIGSMGESLIGLQENKMSRISVDRQVIQSAGGSEVALGLSSSPFNVDIYFSGDYGCGDNPESVLIQDGQVFFADVSRSAICRMSSSQLYPISEKSTRNLFNNIFTNVRAAANPRIVSGYSPDRDMYYVTFTGLGANNETVGYDVFGGRGGEGAWISRYTFYPTCYSNQDNTMLSTLYYDPNTNFDYDQELFWRHDSNVYNTFYGDYEQSDITYVSKPDPSMVKTYDALSHEGNSDNWVVQSINTNLMGANDNAGTLAFVEREGSYYAYITRDPGGSKHLRFLGTIASSTTDSLTFDNKINNQPVPANAELMAVVNGNLVTMSTTAGEALVQSVTGARTLDTLTANIDTAVATDGVQVVLRTPAELDSDPIRGHYATIRMTNNAAAQFELYCVNTVLTPSLLHHNRGQ